MPTYVSLVQFTDTGIRAAKDTTHRPFGISAEAAARNHLPDGLRRPILAVPVGDRLRCLALALYGPHATGNALSHEERSMLAELADKAASAFMQINDDQLRRRIAALESELATKTAELAGRQPAFLTSP